jgi:hypothetical protein
MPKQTQTPATNATKAEKLSPVAVARKAHADAGFTGTRYTGLSKTRNAAIADAIDCGTSKASKRTHAQLTPRMHATLGELADTHGDKPFPARGVDRGQAAIFLNSGFLVRHGNTGELAGRVYRDGKTPLMLKLSADTLTRYRKA